MTPSQGIDRAFCERTCRVAAALGWRLEEKRAGESYAYVFHAPAGTTVTGARQIDQGAALTAACRKLAAKLV